MAIYEKIDPSADIINGLAVVWTGQAPLYFDPSPQADGNAIVSQHFASGDSLSHFEVLNGRFIHGPSGTWE